MAVAKNNNYLEAIGIGNVEVLSKVSNTERMFIIKYFLPNLRINLFSVKILETAGIKVIFWKWKGKFILGNDLIGLGNRIILYDMLFKTNKTFECSNFGKEDR